MSGPLTVWTLDRVLRDHGLDPWTVTHRSGWLIHVEDSRAVVMCDDVPGVLDALRMYGPVHEGGRRVVVRLGQPAGYRHSGAVVAPGVTETPGPPVGTSVPGVDSGGAPIGEAGS